MMTQTKPIKGIRATKRLFVALATFLMCVGSATAQNDSFHFGYCSNDIKGVGVGQDKIYYGAAIEITAEQATKFAGCQVTGVSVGFATGVKKDVEIFVTHDLTATPVMTKAGRVSVNRFNDFSFDTPYTITAGQKFYVGFTHYCTSSVSYPMAFDGRIDNYDRRGDYISFSTAKEGLANQWTHIGHNYGNACVRAILTGDNLPVANALPRKLEGPAVAEVGAPSPFTLTVANSSIRPIESLELTLTEGENVSTQSISLSTPIAPNTEGQVSFSYTFIGSGDQSKLSASISKVNDTENDAKSDVVSVIVSANLNVFPRINVVEEFTGTTCANCPRGIVGMEYMEKTYGATNWIGIAVHNYSGDPMRCVAYEEWMGLGISGAPQSTFNRDMNLGPIDPSKDVLERAHLEASPISNMRVKVSVDNVNKAAKTADITATVTSGADADGSMYSLAFVVTEDNVGPYDQTNNYGPVLPPLEGYPTTGRVSQIYNHVARYINSWNGTVVLPDAIVAGQDYSHKHTASTPAVGNMDETSYIVLLIDRTTQEIVNADKVSLKHGNLNPSGVQSVADAVDGNISLSGRFAEYFGEGSATITSLSGTTAAQLRNAQGTHLEPGIYVVAIRNGKSVKTHKIAVK